MVLDFEAAVEGVAEEAEGEAADEEVFVEHEVFAEFGWGVEVAVAGEGAAGVEWFAVFVVAPLAGGAEVFEGEAWGVEADVAASAGGFGAVEFEALS